jgi:hypothetical protein
MTAPDPARDRDRLMADAAGREVPAAVFRVVTAADPDAVTTELIFRGSPLTARMPAPVPALTAALLLSRLFTGEARRQVRRAREAGLSWAELAPVLDVGDGEAAFEWAAGATDDRWRRSSVTWRCPTCGELVSDYGPYESHPDDNESGHARDCDRHVAEVAVWLARQVADDYWDHDDAPDDGGDGTGRSGR